MTSGAFAEVWNQAHHVRIWLATAQESLERATRPSSLGLIGRVLTRGRTSRAHVVEALDGLARAKLALIDLEYAQHRAGMPRTALRFSRFELEAGLDQETVVQLRHAVGLDLAELDSLAASLEPGANLRR